MRVDMNATMVAEVQQFINELRGLVDQAEAAGSDMARVATVYDINLQSVKKLTGADLVVAVSSTADGQVILQKSDPNQTHPFSATELLAKVNDKRNGRLLTTYDYQAVCWKEALRHNKSTPGSTATASRTSGPATRSATSLRSQTTTTTSCGSNTRLAREHRRQCRCRRDDRPHRPSRTITWSKTANSSAYSPEQNRLSGHQRVVQRSANWSVGAALCARSIFCEVEFGKVPTLVVSVGPVGTRRAVIMRPSATATTRTFWISQRGRPRLLFCMAVSIRTSAVSSAVGTTRQGPRALSCEGPYDQIATDLKGAIRVGALTPGTQLPRMKAIAARYSVAPSTVHRAIAILKDEGLVEESRGRRAVVSTASMNEITEVAA